MKNIFLTTIFYSKIREPSNNEVFRKIITELNTLNEQGLTITIDGKQIQIYFQVISLLGDNLGINQICGLEGGFNALYYCRRCRLHIDICKYIHYECPSALRTKENYREDLEKKEHGVKTPCILNDLNNFHIVSNPSLDIMHDIFEGVARYTIEGVLTHLILTFQKITLETVNESIANFGYESLKSKNKPQPLEIESCSEDFAGLGKRKIKCRQSAAEMGCLSRYLGLMIGDRIDRSDEYWNLYIKLRRMIGLITAPTFVLAEIYAIKETAEDFLAEFFRLLREIPPKGHNATHIVEICMLMGPLIHLWSMPLERKHQFGTAVAASTRSHKNLPKTIGVRNQLYMSYTREKLEFVQNKVKLGTIVDENADMEFQRLHSTIVGPLNCKKYSFVKVNGKLIDSGTVLVVKIQEEPEFGKVICIYVAKGYLFFYVKKLNNLDLFNKYYNAYEVEDLPLEMAEKYVVNVEDLPEVEPCVIHTNKDGTFVSSMYDL